MCLKKERKYPRTSAGACYQLTVNVSYCNAKSSGGGEEVLPYPAVSAVVACYVRVERDKKIPEDNKNTAGFKWPLDLIGNFRVAVRLSVTQILRLELELSKCARWATARWHLWLKLKKVCERDQLHFFCLLHFSEDVLWAMWLFTDLGGDSFNPVKFNSRKKRVLYVHFFFFKVQVCESLEVIHKLVIFYQSKSTRVFVLIISPCLFIGFIEAIDIK